MGWFGHANPSSRVAVLAWIGLRPAHSSRESARRLLIPSRPFIGCVIRRRSGIVRHGGETGGLAPCWAADPRYSVPTKDDVEDELARRAQVRATAVADDIGGPLTAGTGKSRPS